MSSGCLVGHGRPSCWLGGSSEDDGEIVLSPYIRVNNELCGCFPVWFCFGEDYGHMLQIFIPT